MTHTTALSQPGGLVVLAYVATVPASLGVLVVLAVGRDRSLTALRRPAAKLAVATHVGLALFVLAGLALGTEGSLGGLLLAAPLVGPAAVGTWWLHHRRDVPPGDGVLYATLAALAGMPVALWAGSIGVSSWGPVSPVETLVGLLGLFLVPAAMIWAVGPRLGRAFEPLPDQRRVAAAGVTLGLVAIPLAAFLFPQVPVGVQPPSTPERPATLTNESVAAYVAETEYVRFHRETGGSGGCSAEVVSRRTAARYLAAESLSQGAEEDEERLREATADQLEDLPTGGHFAVANCAAGIPMGGVFSTGHGDAFWHAVYHVTAEGTDRLGDGREPPSMPTPTPAA